MWTNNTVVAINNYDIPDVVKGTYTLFEEVGINEYKGEDGTSTIEILSGKMYSGTVTFRALRQSDIADIDSHIETVSGLHVYVPTTGQFVDFTALITDKTMQMVRREVGSQYMNVWSLSFSFRQISKLGDVPVPPDSEDDLNPEPEQTGGESSVSNE